VLQKQETQFDNGFPISENANDTNTPKSDQQETPTSATSDQPMVTRSGRISKKPAYENHYQIEFLVFEAHFHQFSEYVYGFCDTVYHFQISI
jgi:hypothetical protein